MHIVRIAHIKTLAKKFNYMYTAAYTAKRDSLKPFIYFVAKYIKAIETTNFT